MIRIKCDKCDRTIDVDSSKAGQKIECPSCGDTNVVPRSWTGRWRRIPAGLGA